VAALRRPRILFRIILPFTGLFAATAALTWLSSSYLISSHLDESMTRQLEQVARVISHSAYVLNPGLLQKMKEVVNAEILVFGKEGRLLGATLPTADPEEEARAIFATRHTAEELKRLREVKYHGERYRALIHPIVLPEHGQAFLALLVPTREYESLKNRIVLGVGGIALVGLLALATAGYLIARTITAPLEELVKATERVSTGDLLQRVSVPGSDEVGILAESFNRMVEKLKVFEERLVESEKTATAGRMVAGLAHEVRNPLTSIKMLVQVIHSRLKNQPEHQAIFAALLEEIDRLDRIIQQFTEQARPVDLHLQEESVHGPLDEVLRLAGETLRAGDITVERRLSPDLPAASIDSEKLKQVFWNLVLNARDAMPRGGLLTVSTLKADDGAIEIRFEDVGQGIRAADLECLFQPFYTTKPEGMGLGLFVSRRIVEKHGGSLLLENRDEGGARARVVLPAGGTRG
jgi:signal transduction histidine kinase